jgi:hypothetical protein
MGMVVNQHRQVGEGSMQMIGIDRWNTNCENDDDEDEDDVVVESEEIEERIDRFHVASTMVKYRPLSLNDR